MVNIRKLKIHLLLFGLLATMFMSCNKACKENRPQACADKPPNGLCQAYFKSWLYDEATNTCKKKGYSGCSEIGFESKKACQECQCN